MNDERPVYKRLEDIEKRLFALEQAEMPRTSTGPFNHNPLAGPYRPLEGIVERVLALTIPPKRGTGIYRITNNLPDPVGTPGAINRAVTDANLKETIGTPGWTATVRPSTAYTDPLKRQVMEEYGLTGDPKDYELDHLVPLCCGGHSTSEFNLWPQPRAGEWGAAIKDLTEVAGMHAILSGVMTLAGVQAGFMKNWIGLHNHLFSNPKLMTLMAALPPPEPEP